VKTNSEHEGPGCNSAALWFHREAVLGGSATHPLLGSVLVIGVGLLRFPFAHTAVWQFFAAWVQSHVRWLR
jgi:hypothetical protein